MTADVEDQYIVGQAAEPVDENGCLVNPRITCRHRDEIVEVDRDRVDYIDISPRMMVSIATAMIPFLPNDDANRALMGANMQRQAVPLLRPEAPIVGTGMEHKICMDSEVVVLAEGDGIVTKMDARAITVAYDNGETKEYKLTKFLRSNHGTCINQHPIVDVGERVHGKYVNENGETVDPTVLADGPATDQGELALGRNILVGFMTWEGYNYEDAVLLNERLVREDVYTSIHLEEYELDARDTKLGPEEITRDIPNVGEDALKDLDERGIIRIGAEVHAGDILVGKVTPKGETDLTAEERLLRAIFGEKAREVRDTSLQGAARRERHRGRRQGVHPRERRRHSAPASTWSCASTSPRRRKIQRRRQDGRPPRQQGRRLPRSAAGGYALPARRHAARHRSEPPRRSVPYEHRSGARSPSRLRRQDARLEGRHAHLRRRDR